MATAFATVVWTNGWWLLAPLSWVVGSIAMCALFVAGHDCGHKSLLTSNRAMEIIGHVTMSPVLYPFWAWKYSHDAHHRHTNQLGKENGVYCDNAWTPYRVDDWLTAEENSRALTLLYRATRVFPPVGSFLHLVGIHYLPGGFRAGRHRNRVYKSIAIVGLTSVALTVGLWIGFGSPLAVLHFWLIPALGFHAWMALYTFLHHTSDDVTFLEADDWNPFAAQMDGTINVFAPRWLSYLHLNIDVHIPHHVSTNIPSYHLRAANDALRGGTWGSYMRERALSVRYLRQQVRNCHLWCSDRDAYRRFRET